MRVGLVIYGSLEDLSGGYLYDRMLVEYLRGQGDSVEVVALPWRNYARHLGDNLSNELVGKLRGLNVDVLLQDELNHPSLFWLNRRVREEVGYPIVGIVHHLRCSEKRTKWANWMYRGVERRYLESLDGFVFNSRTTREVVEGLVGEGKPGVVATPGGDRLKPEMRGDEIARRALAPGPLRVMFLANVTARKGLHTLISALRQVPTADWRLRVVGDLRIAKSYVRRVAVEIKKWGLAENVEFLGALKDEALVRVLRGSQVMAIPSSYEGFGIAYLEGMGFGLAAIGGNSGGAKEIITHGSDGYLIEPGDVGALAGYVGQLLKNRGQLRQMSLAARRKYGQFPTWEQSARRIREYLKGFI